jgi:hypothetical protein
MWKYRSGWKGDLDRLAPLRCVLHEFNMNGHGPRLVRFVRPFAGMIVLASFFAWSVAFAYLDWLASTGPAHPIPASGQVAYLKGLHAIAYVTAPQARIANQYVPIFWLVGAAAAATLLATRPRSTPAAERTSSLRTALSVVVLVAWLILMFWGDQVMSLLFTGSMTLPARAS